jgi:hypothetical protein
LSPTTTSTTSTWEKKRRIAAERKVSAGAEFAEDGGHGRRALSRPMREDSPAARITPQRLVERAIRAR